MKLFGYDMESVDLSNDNDMISAYFRQTLLNPLYWASVPLVWLLLLLSAVLTLHVTGVTPTSVCNSFKRLDAPYQVSADDSGAVAPL